MPNKELDTIFKNTAADSAAQQPDGKIPGDGLIWDNKRMMDYFNAIFDKLNNNSDTFD